MTTDTTDDTTERAARAAEIARLRREKDAIMEEAESCLMEVRLHATDVAIADLNDAVARYVAMYRRIEEMGGFAITLQGEVNATR